MRPGLKEAAARLGFTLAGLVALALVVALTSGGPASTGVAVPGRASESGRPGPYHLAEAGSRRPGDGFCLGCHPSPPHGRSPWSRSMLNHHAENLHCLVCHGSGYVNLSRDLERRDGFIRPLRDGRPLERETEKAWREELASGAPCFSAGPGCLDCHRRGGLLDLAALGYEAGWVARLTGLEDFFTRTPQNKWFFPDIL